MRILTCPAAALGVVALTVLTACGEADPAAADQETAAPAEGVEAAPIAADQHQDDAANAVAADDSPDEPEEKPEEEPPSIREVDFTQLEWVEYVNDVVVTPEEGVEGHIFAVDKEIQYADVNGDGHEDALVAISQTEERWFEDIWYIWAWDAEAETAYQAGGPVARSAMCGDYVESVGAGEDHFVIEEYLWPQNLDHDCASTPSIQITRHLVLEEDWPVMISPVRADGGMCPQILGTDDLWPVEDFAFRTAPWDTASLVGDPDPAGFAEVDVWDRLWLFRENWMLVHLAYLNPADGPPVIEGDYTPCGWTFLEHDTRPIPHDPYLPED